MSENTYASAAGIVQFDTETKDVNGKTVLQFTFRNFSGQKNVRVTVWPELKAELEAAGKVIKKYTVVAVDGKFTVSSSNDGREFHNISASGISILDQLIVAAAAGPGVASKPAAEPAF